MQHLGLFDTQHSINAVLQRTPQHMRMQALQHNTACDNHTTQHRQLLQVNPILSFLSIPSCCCC
jgi:hypothetical protein